MKKLLFKKGIYTIIFPFLIHDLSPWQEQIANEIKRHRNKYAVRKSARWGFEITEHGADIKVYKK